MTDLFLYQIFSKSNMYIHFASIWCHCFQLLDLNQPVRASSLHPVVSKAKITIFTDMSFTARRQL